MRIWNAKRLANELSLGEVSERGQLPYLIVFLALSLLASNRYILELMSDFAPNFFDLLITLGVFVIAISGTIYCYSAATENHPYPGFIARYICLGTPAAIRFLVIIYALAIALGIIIGVVSLFLPLPDGWFQTSETGWIEVLLVWILSPIYFIYLRILIKDSYAIV